MSLLSLSVFCDEVADLKVQAARPALLFRLYDFPTVLVRPAAPGAVDVGDSLIFAHGKSCLLDWPSGERPAGTPALQTSRCSAPYRSANS